MDAIRHHATQFARLATYLPLDTTIAPNNQPERIDDDELWDYFGLIYFGEYYERIDTVY